jgi:hypothetical protein
MLNFLKLAPILIALALATCCGCSLTIQVSPLTQGAGPTVTDETPAAEADKP